ncbi:hypothetical protein [Jannaschia seohaensis]|uniref:hypothetical protein n=1 Tax=Jannaschia seohaensis TaxID=475081 RepID=UPI000D6AD181|nr:hypothetical protein [Jannaschia seohaensis]
MMTTSERLGAPNTPRRTPGQRHCVLPMPPAQAWAGCSSFASRKGATSGKQLRQDIIDELDFDPSIDADEIEGRPLGMHITAADEIAQRVVNPLKTKHLGSRREGACHRCEGARAALSGRVAHGLTDAHIARSHGLPRDLVAELGALWRFPPAP